MLASTDSLNKINELLDNSTWAHALYLNERERIEINNSINEDNVTEWLQKFNNNKELLLERLDQEKITYSQFTSILSSPQVDHTYKKMEWFLTIKEIFLQTKDEHYDEELDKLFSKDVPFISFIIPFVNYVKAKIFKEINQTNTLHIFEKKCIDETIVKLVSSTIFKYSLKTLIYELNKSRIQNELSGDTPEERYNYFEKEKIGKPSQVLAILSQYPVLARLISEAISNIINNLIRFINQFTNDHREIETTFEISITKVINIQALGDSHNKGQHVLKLDFNDKHSIIYKPRSLSIDIHFQQFLNWINEKNEIHNFKTIKVINKGTYGWQEFVTYKDCATEEEVRRFYERQGQYLCVLHFLNATDFHYENLIAHGEHPMLIDLESLFHTTIKSDQSLKSPANRKAINILNDSIARTGLLPIFVDNDLFDIDVSGIGGGKKQQVERYKIDKVKTDEMRLIKGPIYLEAGLNLPKINGQVCEAFNYTQSIKEGFYKTYKLLENYKEALLSTDSPIHAFSKDKVRIILRNTIVYSHLLDASTHPKYLKSGIDRVKLFDYMWLIVDYIHNRKNAAICECKDLLAGDVPYFYVDVDSTKILTHQNFEIKDMFAKDSFNMVLEKIKNMGEEDCNRQLDFIEKSLLTKYYLDINNMNKAIEDFNKKSSYEGTLLNKDAFLTEAIRIANVLEKEAIWAEDFSDVTWIGIGMSSDEKLNYKAMDMGIYDGILGMAIFFAYVGKESGIPKFEKIARACLQTALNEKNATKKAYISAFSGYSSAVYVLTHFYKLWGEKELLGEAINFINEIEPHIDKDTTFDLLNGSAGTLLVLLNFYKVTGFQKALDIAIKCGDHLLKNAVKVNGGVAWTISPKHTPLTGLSHGTSGIALALIRLTEETGDQNYLNAALQALNYENSTFSSKENNWLDLRQNMNRDTPKSVIHWCNGTVGIGMARLKILEHYQSEIFVRDLEKSIEVTIERGFLNPNYSLCHGDLGNLDLLLLAATSIDKYKPLSKFVYEKASSMLQYVQEDNQNWKCGIPGGQQTPNFMVGLSGIGYQLLRLYNSELPSVLTLE
ncbi:type 2 lanthipeptide synthetase LanM family protein [Bacillus mycoides]|uniref:type 2 lanthipeptide synthetase LanM family protein n=1 Tax=Bacillus mycoides TaxID=1405 RepID=UPI0025A2A12F|nr:type 2 lanthipeptide synthetase LanM family protein [Bacillus mycoides]MDM5431194.1 type 2 lanthipeptide synthetase LanM family protein [Bacillus mycoides]